MIQKPRQHGGMLLLSGLLLIAVSGMVALVISSNTKSVPRSHDALNRAEYMLTGFVFAHSRLPCPDSNHDGLEDCDTASLQGRLPYKTLGLISPLVNEYGGHIHYAPYRKADDTALEKDVDLVTKKNRYKPDVALNGGLPDSTPTLTLLSENLIDFCQAIKHQKTLAYDVMQPNIGSPETNLAVILIDPGANTQLEGENASVNMTFAKPSDAQGINYDDMVKTLSFDTLSAQFACTGLLTSIDLLVYSTEDAKFAYDNAETMVDNAEADVALTAVDTALSALSLAILAGHIAASSTNAGIYAGLCAASLGLAVNTCVGAGMATASAIAGGVTVTVSIASLAIQIASVVTAGINLDKAKDLRDQIEETHELLVKEAVYADMRGGVE